MAIFTALAVTGALSTVAAVGLGVATYGTAYGVSQTKKSVKLGQQAVAVQTEAAATQRKQEAARETKSRRASIRSFLRQRKRIEAAGAVGAGRAVSARGGALGSLSSQLGTNLGFSSMMSGLSSQYSSLTQQASMLRGQSDYYGALGGLGFQVAGMGSFSGLSSLGGGSAEPNMSKSLPYTDSLGYGVG